MARQPSFSFRNIKRTNYLIQRFSLTPATRFTRIQNGTPVATLRDMWRELSYQLDTEEEVSQKMAELAMTDPMTSDSTLMVLPDYSKKGK